MKRACQEEIYRNVCALNQNTEPECLPQFYSRQRDGTNRREELSDGAARIRLGGLAGVNAVLGPGGSQSKPDAYAGTDESRTTHEDFERAW